MPSCGDSSAPENHCAAADSSPASRCNDSSPASRGIEESTQLSGDPPSPAEMLDADVQTPTNLRCVLDSVAADHATGTAEILSGETAPPPGGASFRRRDGKSLPATAVGSICTPRFGLPGVLLVPGLGPESIIVSVRQLACRGLAVSFGGEVCSVKERDTGVVVGEGRIQEDDGLYHLDFLRIPQIS